MHVNASCCGGTPQLKCNSLTFLRNKGQSWEPVKSPSVRQILLILNREHACTISHLVLKWEIKEFTLIGSKSILNEKILSSLMSSSNKHSFKVVCVCVNFKLIISCLYDMEDSTCSRSMDASLPPGWQYHYENSILRGSDLKAIDKRRKLWGDFLCETVCPTFQLPIALPPHC